MSVANLNKPYIDLEHSLTKGDLDVVHLKRMWCRAMRDRSGIPADAKREDEWALDNVIYHGLSLPIEETIQFLYQIAPSFAEFEKWVLERNGGTLNKNTLDRINVTIEGLLSGSSRSRSNDRAERLLTAADMDRWNKDGYVVVSGLYSPKEVDEAEHAVWEHLGMNPEDADTWYGHPRDHGIMVQFFDHPALNAIRESAKARCVFAELWGSTDLWVSKDRVSFNPPERTGHEFPGPRLHWDVSLELPIPFGVQGLVYLTDTIADQGAFTCVPGFHNRIENWMNDLPKGVDPRSENIEKLGAVPIPGKAGDLVIWHQALPHGSRPNRSTRPRIVQYITMFPAAAAYAGSWK